MTDQTPLQTNAIDDGQRKHADRKVKEKGRRRVALMRQQLSTADGREFVWLMLRELGLYEDAQGDVERVYGFLGRRRAGLRLLGEVMQHPQRFLEMQAEAMARDERDNQENDAARTPRATT